MVEEYNEIILNFTNEKGNSIYSIYSYKKGKRPLVVITPQYEKTIRNNLIPMLYLINNGFNVFRYDNTFHRGNSYGEFKDFTLGSSLDDLEAVSRYIKENDQIDSDCGIILLGISISCRTALRFLSRQTDIYDSFISLVGVVDMQSTLKTITQRDIIREFINNPGKTWGVRKALNFAIDYDNFLSNCINENYHCLKKTKEDIDKIKTDTYIIYAEQDSWIDSEAYAFTFNDNKTILKDMYKIPDADHLLYKNYNAVKNALHKILKILYKCFYMQDIYTEEIKSPVFSEVLELNRQERKRQKKHTFLKHVN